MENNLLVGTEQIKLFWFSAPTNLVTLTEKYILLLGQYNYNLKIFPFQIVFIIKIMIIIIIVVVITKIKIIKLKVGVVGK